MRQQSEMEWNVMKCNETLLAATSVIHSIASLHSAIPFIACAIAQLMTEWRNGMRVSHSILQSFIQLRWVLAVAKQSTTQFIHPSSLISFVSWMNGCWMHWIEINEWKKNSESYNPFNLIWYEFHSLIHSLHSNQI